MPDAAERDHLLDKRYLSIVVRLLMDQQKDLQGGSLVDLNGDTIGRFRQLDEIPELISAWLETQVATCVLLMSILI